MQEFCFSSDSIFNRTTSDRDNLFTVKIWRTVRHSWSPVNPSFPFFFLRTKESIRCTLYDFGFSDLLSFLFPNFPHNISVGWTRVPFVVPLRESGYVQASYRAMTGSTKADGSICVLWGQTVIVWHKDACYIKQKPCCPQAIIRYISCSNSTECISV